MRDGVEFQRAGVRRQLQQFVRRVELRGERIELPANEHGDLDGDRQLRQQHQPQPNDYSGGHDGADGDDAAGQRRDQSMRDGVEFQRAGVRRQLQQFVRRVELHGHRHELPANEHGDLDGDRQLRQQHEPQPNYYSGGHDGADSDDTGGCERDQSMRHGVEFQRAGVRRQLQQFVRRVELRGERIELPANEHGDLDGDRQVRQQHQPQPNYYSGGHDGADGDDTAGQRRDQSMRDGVEFQRAGVRRQLQQFVRRVELRGERHELPANEHGDLDGDRQLRQQHEPQPNYYSGGHDGADSDDTGGCERDQSMRDGVEFQRAGVRRQLQQFVRRVELRGERIELPARAEERRVGEQRRRRRHAEQ